MVFDIIIDDKKAAGILCEADKGVIYLGIGINTIQRKFSDHLKNATSLSLAANLEIFPDEIFLLLEKILIRLHQEIKDDETTMAAQNWNPKLTNRLYKKDKQIVFIEGASNSGAEIKGTLIGIGNNGEILILPAGEQEPRSFFTGKLEF